MADNVSITQGVGTIIATDEIGGIMYQRVKIGVGPDGSATDLAFGQAPKAASLPVTIASDQDTLPVSQVSFSYKSIATKTRSTDVTPYTAGDNVLGAWSFSNIAPAAGGSIILTCVQLEIDISTVPSGMSTYTLHLYSANPPSAAADNGVFDLAAGDRSIYLGYVNIDTPIKFGSTLYVENIINKQLKLPGSSIYAYLVTTGAYTPNSGTVYTLTLHSLTV